MPEEINRVVTDHLATLNFCPTTVAIANLAAGRGDQGVHHVGDVMYDATLFVTDKAEQSSTILTDLGLLPKQYALATIHRAENTDDREQLLAVVRFLQDQSRKYPVVLPLHPRT